MADETKSTGTENPTGTQPTEGKQDTPTVEELMAQLATEKADRAKEKQAIHILLVLQKNTDLRLSISKRLQTEITPRKKHGGIVREVVR
jgi:hypothetical protein